MKVKRTGIRKGDVIWLGALLWPFWATGEVEIGFEDLALSVPPLEEYTGPGGGVYYNGSDGAGGFLSGGTWFETVYDTQFMTWSGWAYSTTADRLTGSYTNEFSNITGEAANGDVFAVAYYSAYGAVPTVVLPETARTPLEMKVTNATYPFLSMRDGDAFARQFGEGDYFKMILKGYAADDSALGTVEVFLADYRAETDPNVLLSDWITVDLSPLNNGTTEAVAEIRMTFESSDSGEFGINTPTYVAVDDLVLAGGWGGYLVSPDGWVNTGAFLGWVFPVGDYIWIHALASWAYFPEETVTAGNGTWLYLHR